MANFVKPSLFFAVIAVAGGFGWYLWQVSPNANAQIRIGINPWVGYEYLYLAEHKGFLDEEGLNVELLEYGSLEDVKVSFELGQTDGITSTVAEVIQANADGKRTLQSVLVADFSNGADVILAKSPIGSVKQLHGKKIAVERASLGIFILARALEKSGLTLDDVQPLAFDQPGMLSAMADGSIDAAVTYPPYAIEMTRQGNVHRIFDSSALPGEILDVISLDSALLAQRPHLAAAFARAWTKALAYAEQHPQDAYTIMSQRQGISVDEFALALKGIHLVTSEEQSELMKPGGRLEHALVFMSGILHRSGDLAKTVDDPGKYVFRTPPQ